MGLFDNAELKEAKRLYKEETRQLSDNMKPTGKIFMCAKWDDNLRVISIGSMGSSTLIKYDSITGVDVIVDVKEVTSTKTKGKEKRKGVMTRAVVGTVLMPGVGTLAGALTAKKHSTGESESVTNQQVTKTIVLTRNDPFKTVLNFPYNADLEVKLRSILTENIAKLSQPLVTQQLEQPVKEISVADELIKLKELLDAGILTEEEFQLQKQKILS